MHNLNIIISIIAYKLFDSQISARRWGKRNRAASLLCLTLSRFPSFISTRDISTTLSRRIDNARRVRYDRISGRSRGGIPYVPSPILFLAEPLLRVGVVCKLWLHLPAACPPIPLCFLIPPQLKYRHVLPTPYSWTLTTKPASSCVTCPPFVLSDSHTIIPRPIRFTILEDSPAIFIPLCAASVLPVFAKTHGNVFSGCSGRRREI